jgi:uncharacterized membrane protein YfcA
VTDALRYLLAGLIVLLSHFQEGITGFGCTVLALPFVVLLVGLRMSVPVLVMQAWVTALFIVLEARRFIAWVEFAHILVPVASGLPLGMWIAKILPEDGLKWALAAFMVGVGIEGLLRNPCTSQSLSTSRPKKHWLARTFLFGGGVIHGAFGTGGPLVVAYAARTLPNKSLFRVTLCLLWLVLNTVMIGHWFISKSLSQEVLFLTIVCLPFTLVGVVLGNAVHYRVNECIFRRVVYIVLIGSGVLLVWSPVR